MFWTIFLFEIRYRLKRPVTYIYFVLMLGLGLLYGAILGGAFGPELTGMLSQGKKLDANSPYLIHLILKGVVPQIGIFIIAAFMAVGVYKDFQYNIHPFFFTKPISKFSYLGGRYLATFLITYFSLLWIGIGLMLSEVMPYTTPEKYGSFNFIHYAYPYVVDVLPFLIFAGSVFFATVTLSRNQLFIYLNAIVILVFFIAASTLAQQIDNETLAALLDPTGNVAFVNETESWTSEQANTQLLPLTRDILLNISIWMTIGIGILIFTYVKFQFNEHAEPVIISRRRKKGLIRSIGDTVNIKSLDLPKVVKSYGAKAHRSLLAMLFRRELTELLVNPIAIVMLVVGLLILIINLAFAGQFGGTRTLPVTYEIISFIEGSFLLFIMAILIFFSGEMLWKERQLKVAEIYDSYPIPSWIAYVAKFLSLAFVPIIFMGIGILAGIIAQMTQGYFRFEIGLYVQELLVHRMVFFLIFLALAFFIQSVVPNKFVGFFLVVAVFFLSNTILPLIGVEDNLFQYNSSTSLAYSDMNGFGHLLGPYWIFKSYWGSLALILLVLGMGISQRGTETHLLTRMNRLSDRIGRIGKFIIGGALIFFIVLGSYIFYNTHILNEYTTSKEQQKLTADYEKRFKQYEDHPQARIADIRLDIELYPSDRRMEVDGNYLLVNKNHTALDSIHIITSSDMEFPVMEFDRAYDTALVEEDFGYRIYTLEEPLAPGDSINLHFVQKFDIQGFPNSGPNSQLIKNGTFLDSYYFPSIGYNRDFELQNADLRKKYNLGERERFPSIDDTLSVYNSFLSREADWINLEVKIGTEKGQTAIVPGYLQEQWEKDNRSYFHYKTESRIQKFFSIVSASYEVVQDHWINEKGDTVNLEIYYHKPHTYNLEKMMQTMKASLEYASKNFSPYQHRQMRILEFPRYRGFAQSFANTVPFSEAAGFIMDSKDDEIDYPVYVTAHEMAHQWWGHQVVPGYVQGFQFLSESMSQYTALMVMQQLQGKDKIKNFLRHELDNYLIGRTAEKIKEQPALLVENQLYIHYQKGSLVMYALQDLIGEDTLNAALKRYMTDVSQQEPPYTTTKDWKEYVWPVVPDSLKPMFVDMFEKVILYDNRIKEAYFTEKDSQYVVTLEVEGKKVEDLGLGDEIDVPMEDYIDIGIFGRVKVDGEWKDSTLYLTKHKILTGSQEIQITVPVEPNQVGIDPFYKMIDRTPGNNTKKPTKKDDTNDLLSLVTKRREHVLANN